MRDFVTPPSLNPGDKIAVLAPSSGGARDSPHVFELGLQRLRDRFDLEPVVYPTARQELSSSVISLVLVLPTSTQRFVIRRSLESLLQLEAAINYEYFDISTLVSSELTLLGSTE